MLDEQDARRRRRAAGGAPSSGRKKEQQRDRARRKLQLGPPGRVSNSRARPGRALGSPRRVLVQQRLGNDGTIQGVPLAERSSAAVSSVSSPGAGSLRPFGSPTFDDALRGLRGLVPSTGETPPVSRDALSRVVSDLLTGDRNQPSPFIGQETVDQLQRHLGFENFDGIASTPQPSQAVPYNEASTDLITPDATPDHRPEELEPSGTRMTAADPHGAAYDAYGSGRAGDEAEIGITGGASTMRDYIRALYDLSRLTGASDADENDSDAGTDDDDLDFSTDEDDAPAAASAGTDARGVDAGTDARGVDSSTQATGNDASTQADITAELNVKARRDAADAMRRSPGIMKLIKSGIFKFDDFLTNGALDLRKIAAVRRDIADRVESTEESYARAARAKGYTPSGAAFPIEGINNIVAGVRRIPGTKYVMYQGPQYVNG